MYLFDHFGKLDLARPALGSIGMITVAIAMRWHLRRHKWFWAVMVALAAAHVPLILLVPWTSKWVPAVVMIPIAVGDLYAMLAVLSIIGQLEDKVEIVGPRGTPAK